jgi:glycosyltransferase involved in cell wall biosynthesis
MPERDMSGRSLPSANAPSRKESGGGPTVSVVIPSYNHARFIGQAIRSVLEQSFCDLELVVVDDGSTDNSREIIDAELAAARIPVEAIFQPNAGAHTAIMRGVERSRGRLLAILNSDDWYEADRFSMMVPLVDGRDDVFAFSEVRFVDESGAPLPPDSDWPRWWRGAVAEHDLNPTTGFSLFVQNYSVTSGNFLFSRTLYEKLEGFGPQKLSHDWDFLIRATYFCEPEFVRKPLINYRAHGTNTTETVRHLLVDEARTGLRRYKALLGSGRAPNKLAPAPENWPSFFELFRQRRTPFYGREPLNEIFG